LPALISGNCIVDTKEIRWTRKSSTSDLVYDARLNDGAVLHGTSPDPHMQGKCC
jgi:hypothetical protein